MKNELEVIDGVLPTIVNNGLGPVIKPLMKEIFLYETYIAGTSHIEDQSVFYDLKEDVSLILQREAENKFDKYAIVVLNENHEKLGYIPRTDNKIFARLMDAGKMLKGKVVVVFDMDYYWDVRIKIYMVDF